MEYLGELLDVYKFKGISVKTKEYVEGNLVYSFTGIPFICTTYDHILGMMEMFEIIPETLGMNTGLEDKNGRIGYTNSDIWEIKDYRYATLECIVPCGISYKRTDLRFVLRQTKLALKLEFINPPKDLDQVSINVIFNLPDKNGKRLFIDVEREKLEIIGSIYDNLLGI